MMCGNCSMPVIHDNTGDGWVHFYDLISCDRPSPTPSPSVTADASTYGAVTGGNGRSPQAGS